MKYTPIHGPLEPAWCGPDRLSVFTRHHPQPCPVFQPSWLSYCSCNSPGLWALNLVAPSTCKSRALGLPHLFSLIISLIKSYLQREALGHLKAGGWQAFSHKGPDSKYFMPLGPCCNPSLSRVGPKQPEGTCELVCGCMPETLFASRSLDLPVGCCLLTFDLESAHLQSLSAPFLCIFSLCSPHHSQQL